jgi:hypothetical protein
MAKKIKIKEIASKTKIIELKKERDESVLESELDEHSSAANSGTLVAPSLAFNRREPSSQEVQPAPASSQDSAVARPVTYETVAQREQIRYDTQQVTAQTQAPRARQTRFIPKLLGPQESALRDPLERVNPLQARGAFQAPLESDAGIQRREYDLSETARSELESKKRRDWRL